MIVAAIEEYILYVFTIMAENVKALSFLQTKQ